MPDITTKQDYALYQQTVAQFIEEEGLSFLSTGTVPLDTPEEKRDEYVDSWFSWRPCECCQSDLGGNREYLYARDRQDEIVSFEICEDCVYYVNYGRLDDMTMRRIEDSAVPSASQTE